MLSAGAEMMDLGQRIEALETQLRDEPESLEIREELLGLYSNPAFQQDLRKVAHVLWVVQRHPRTSFARCPLARLYGERMEDGRQQVEHEWQRHVDEHPRDPLLIRGLASFVSSFDRARACTLLEAFVVADPSDAEVWMELGRIHPTPARSLLCLQEARRLGSSQPNLGHTVLGVVALRAGDAAKALEHLRCSAQVGKDYRLSSYGPSFDLAQPLCEHGYWFAVADYLAACESFWNVDRLRELRSDVERQRMPDF